MAERQEVRDPLRQRPGKAVLPVANVPFVQPQRQTGVGDNMAKVADALAGFGKSLGGLSVLGKIAQDGHDKAAIRHFNSLPRDRQIAYGNQVASGNAGHSNKSMLQVAKTQFSRVVLDTPVTQTVTFLIPARVRGLRRAQLVTTQTSSTCC